MLGTTEDRGNEWKFIMPCLCSDYFMWIFKTPFHHETGTPVDAIVTAVGLQHSQPPSIDQSLIFKVGIWVECSFNSSTSKTKGSRRCAKGGSMRNDKRSRQIVILSKAERLKNREK